MSGNQEIVNVTGDMNVIEKRLDEKFARGSCIGHHEKLIIYQSIMCEALPPIRIIQKFAWFQCYPINYDDEC